MKLKRILVVGAALLLGGCADELVILKGGPVGDRLPATFKGKVPPERVEEAWQKAMAKAAADLGCTSYNGVRDTVYRQPTGQLDEEGKPTHTTHIEGTWQCRHEALPGTAIATVPTN